MPPTSEPTPSIWSLLRPYRRLVIALVVAAIVSNALSLVLPLLISYGIDAYINGTLVLNTVVMKFTILTIVIFLFTYVQSILQTYTSERVARDLRTELSAKISRKSYAGVQAAEPSTLLTNLTGDIDSVKLFVSQAIVSLISSVVVIIGASALLLYIEWRLALAVLALLPLIAGTFFTVFKKVRKLFLESREIIDALNKVINESILGAAIIRVLNTMRIEEVKFVGVNTRARDLGYQILGLFSWMIPVVTFIANFATIVILALGGYFVIQGGLSFGDFAAFNSYLALLIYPIFVIGFVSSILAQASASYTRVAAVLASPEPTARGTVRPEVLHGAIEVQQLTRTVGEKTIFKDISFTVKPGTKTAIVGPTAAGKSQLLYTLIGLVEPTQGTVFYDDKPLYSYDPEQLHARVGFVFQDSSVFNMSVRENIAFSTSVSEAAMTKAIAAAELQGVVDALPDGLASIISERGTTLSGGQKQRLMLARALALEPSVLFLDDFTARVDARTEAAILKNIETHYPGITLLSVTQKIASVEQYDQILVMMEGELLAAGTHTHLLATCPEYVQLYEAQRSTHTYEV